MNATETKMNYFRSKLDEVRRLEMDLKMKVGNFDREFKDWLREQGLPEQCHLIDVISHFTQKKIELL
jgi:hypothetical protein